MFDTPLPEIQEAPAAEPEPTRPAADMDAPWDMTSAPVDKPRAALAPADF